MPPRLGCKKSRNGCVRCKHRKVKCDEQKPTCSACLQHTLSCEYPKRRQVTHKPVSAGHFSSSSPATASPGDSPSNRSREGSNEVLDRHRLLELSLLHYYVTTIAPTYLYVDREFGLRLQSVQIPQLALQNSNLLNAIFAYALLHMHVEAVQSKFPDNVDFFEELGLHIPQRVELDTPASEEQSSRTELLVLHGDYLDKALTAQRNAVSEISERNADAACITAILIGMTTLVYASQRVHAGESTTYTVPLQWFHLSRSFTAVLKVSRSLLSPDSAVMKMVDAYPQQTKNAPHLAKSLSFQYLLTWQPHSGAEVLDEPATAAYDTAVSCIETVYRWIVDGQPREALGRLILAFPNLVSDVFVTFVEQGRPRALVLLAHLLAMSQKLDTVWWIFRGVAKFHVNGIAGLVPHEWQWTLAWPLQVVSTGIVRQD